MVFGEDAVAEERHGRALRQVAELDGERVHRDGAEHAPPRPSDQHLGARQTAPEAVRVADRDEPDPRRPLGDEAAAVARALPRRERLRLRDVAHPREHRLEAVRGRIVSEGREPVERDPAPDGVQPGCGHAQRRRAVREMGRHALEFRRERGERVDLAAGEDLVLVGGREVAHQADDLLARTRARLVRGHAEPPHARVHLEVHAAGPPGAPGSRRRPRAPRRGRARRRRERAGP